MTKFVHGRAYNENIERIDMFYQEEKVLKDNPLAEKGKGGCYEEIISDAADKVLRRHYKS